MKVLGSFGYWSWNWSIYRKKKSSENWKEPQEANWSWLFQIRHRIFFLKFLIKLQDDRFPDFIYHHTDKWFSNNHWGEERGRLKQKLSFSSLHTSAPGKSFFVSNIFLILWKNKLEYERHENPKCLAHFLSRNKNLFTTCL